MKTSHLVVILLFIAPAFAWSQSTSILFVGNSYTYVNSLPQMVMDVAMSKGDSVTIDMSAPGGYTFQNHCTNATTLAKINSGLFDFVVLQEQSQLPSFPPSQVATDVYPYAHQLDSLIHKANSCATTVFYMTWGRKYGDVSNCSAYPPICTYSGMQERLRESYMTMADSNSALVAPAGMAWNSSWSTDSSINLWQADNSHPSLEGSYLTACTMYSTIFKKSPVGAFVPTGLDSTTASFLQDIALHTVLDSLTNWNVGLFDCKADFAFNASQLNVQFLNQSQNASSYNWNFGDGYFASSNSPIHIYFNQGTYNVTLITTDFCTIDSITKVVSVNSTGINAPENPSIYITPQGNNTFNVSNIPTSSNYRVISSSGKIVEEGIVKNGDHTFDFKKLASGYYVLQLNADSVKSFPLLVK